MCGFIGTLTGIALLVLVVLHPIGWLILIGILCVSGTAGVAAFINGLLNIGKK